MARRAMAGSPTSPAPRAGSSDGRLDERVPVTRSGDEIDQLAATFNLMLDRIQALVDRHQEMTDNIAHDLKSPITRIRGQAEIALTPRCGRRLEELAGDRHRGDATGCSR